MQHGGYGRQKDGGHSTTVSPHHLLVQGLHGALTSTSTRDSRASIRGGNMSTMIGIEATVVASKPRASSLPGGILSAQHKQA